MAFGERPEKRIERLGRLKERFPDLSSFGSPTLALQVNLRRSERQHGILPTAEAIRRASSERANTPSGTFGAIVDYINKRGFHPAEDIRNIREPGRIGAGRGPTLNLVGEIQRAREAARRARFDVGTDPILEVRPGEGGTRLPSALWDPEQLLTSGLTRPTREQLGFLGGSPTGVATTGFAPRSAGVHPEFMMNLAALQGNLGIGQGPSARAEARGAGGKRLLQPERFREGVRAIQPPVFPETAQGGGGIQGEPFARVLTPAESLGVVRGDAPPTRRPAGVAGQGLGELAGTGLELALGAAESFSGEAWLNEISRIAGMDVNFIKHLPGGGQFWTAEDALRGLSEIIGRDVNVLQHLPPILREIANYALSPAALAMASGIGAPAAPFLSGAFPLRTAADVALAPPAWALAGAAPIGLGARTAQLLKLGTTGAPRGGLPRFAGALGAETALGTSATLAAENPPLGVPPAVAGAVGGLGPLGLPRAARTIAPVLRQASRVPPAVAADLALGARRTRGSFSPDINLQNLDFDPSISQELRPAWDDLSDVQKLSIRRQTTPPGPRFLTEPALAPAAGEAFGAGLPGAPGSLPSATLGGEILGSVHPRRLRNIRVPLRSQRGVQPALGPRVSASGEAAPGYASRVADAPSRLAPTTPQLNILRTQFPETGARLIAVLRNAAKIGEQRLDIPAPLRGRFDEATQTYGTPSLAAAARQGQRITFTQAEVDEMRRSIERWRPQLLNAFDDLFLNGTIPELGSNTMKEFDLQFGAGFSAALQDFRSTRRQLMDLFWDVTGVPRAVLASGELSAAGRQGALLVRNREWWEGLGPMVKSGLDERTAARVNDDIIGGPMTRLAADQGDASAVRAMERAQVRRDAGLELTSAGGSLTEREEIYQSSVAEAIPVYGPIIKASNRSYTNYLNRLRSDIFDERAAQLRRQNLTPDELSERLRENARWINIATGRGDLSQRWQQSDWILLGNRVFFSSKYNISRFQSLQEAGRLFITEPLGITGHKSARGLSAAHRRAVAADIVGFVLGGVGTMAALNHLGVWEVELDPTKGDFGKGLIGNTRIDPWAGFQQIATLVARLATEIQNPTEDVSELGIVGRFLRSKLDPGVPAFLMDWQTGETYMGDEFELGAMKTPDTLKLLQSKLVPIFWGDLADAVKLGGIKAGLYTLPGVIGVSADTYESLYQIQNRVSKETPDENGRLGIEFENANAAHERRVNEHPDVVEAKERYNEKYTFSEQMNIIQDQAAEARANAEEEILSNLTADSPLVGADLHDKLRKILGFDGTLTRELQGFYRLVQEDLDALQNYDKKTLEDLFGALYWSIQPEELHEHSYDDEAEAGQGRVTLDFQQQRRRREEVLDAAAMVGVDTNYITRRDGQGYLDLKFEDERVREVVAEYYDFLHRLGGSGYHDLHDQSWSSFTRQAGIDTGGLDYFEYRRAELDRQMEQEKLHYPGTTDSEALFKAEIRVSRLDLFQNYLSFHRLQFRIPWVQRNREIAREAILLGYSSSKVEKIIVGLLPPTQ